jgi:DNA-binding NarL/FixJ family response regulator
MIRVVIADDHAVVRLGMRALLDSAPDVQAVGEANDGEEALRVCAEQSPDVVIMDLSMAGMDGLTAIRALARRSSPPAVLALTMHEEADYLVPALEAGAMGYVVKSAASQDLLAAIRTVASGRMWVNPSAAPLLASNLSRRSVQDDTRTRYETLSTRERDVFRLLAYGHGSTEIGELLHLSPKTVDTYKRRVNEKLGVQTRSDHVRLALALGVLQKAP